MEGVILIENAYAVKPRNYQMVFSDIDGTLLTDEHKVTVNTQKRIQKLKQDGISFVLVSARMPEAIYPIQNQLGIRDYIASYSGGLILDSDRQPVYSVGMERNKAIAVRNNMLKLCPDICCNTYSYSIWIVDDYNDPRVRKESEIVNVKPIKGQLEDLIPKEQMIHKFLCIGNPERISELEMYVQEQYPELAVCKSNPEYLEVMDAGAIKSKVITVLAGEAGIKVEDTIAFGDNYNDLSMLLAAGVGVAMGNAPERIKEQAKYITKTNNDDGIVWMLNELLK